MTVSSREDRISLSDHERRLRKEMGTLLTSTKCTVIVSVQSRGAEGSGPRSTGTDNGGRCCGASTGNRVGNQGRTGKAHALRGDVRQA